VGDATVAMMAPAMVLGGGSLISGLLNVMQSIYYLRYVNMYVPPKLDFVL
jgi:hypothetical protein